MSKVPRSDIPPSEAPESKYGQSRVAGTRAMPDDADSAESRAPQSRTLQSKAPKTRAMPDDVDRAESKPPQSRASESRASESRAPQSKAPQSKTPQSIVPQSKVPQSKVPQTRMMPTDADRAESRAPQSEVPQSRTAQSKAPQSRASQSQAPKSQAPKTRAMLGDADRAESRVAQSRGPGASRVPASKPSYDDDEYDDEPEFAPAEKQPKSILFTSRDKTMAERHSRYATLTPKEQSKQDDWAHEMFKNSGICPENSKWVREAPRAPWFNHGGYRCSKDGHVVTDPLLVEGLGAMYVTVGGKKEKLYTKDNIHRKVDCIFGPYYSHPFKTDNGETCIAEDMVKKGFTIRSEEWIAPPESIKEKLAFIERICKMYP